MTMPRYQPGQWRGIISDSYIALLPPESEHSVVQRLWESMTAGEDLMNQLVIITDGRFAGLPAFAIAQIEENQVHLMLRGPIEIKIARGEAEQTFSAPAVSTWLEQIVDDVTSVSFIPPPGAGSPGRDDLPIEAGVVLTSHIEVRPAPPAPRREAQQEPRAKAAPKAPSPSQPAAVSKAPAVPEEPQVAASPIPPPPDAREPRRESEEVAAPVAEAAFAQEDHDGMTIMNSEVVALRQQLPAWEGDAVPGPLVDPADRSVVPKIVLSTGMAVALDRPILLGRAPQVSRVKNDEMPRLITVESPNHDISRTHAEVRMSGSEIVVTDLTSTNGVLLTRPGAVAERLKPGEPTAVEAGAVVDLGEGVTFVVGRQA